MVEPRSSATRFASALIGAERARDGGRDSDVVQRIMKRIHLELGKVLGPAGVDVLLARRSSWPDGPVRSSRAWRLAGGGGEGGPMTTRRNSTTLYGARISES